MQIAPYRDSYDEDRQFSQSRKTNSGGHGGGVGQHTPYDSARQYEHQGESHERRHSLDYSPERGDRESARNRDTSGRDKKKDIGATILGGVVGALAGHEAGHKDGLVTLIGAAAGAFGGHELEKHHEKKKDKKRTEQEESAYHHGRGDIEYSDPYGGGNSDSEDDGQRRQHDHHHHHHRHHSLDS